MDLRFSRAELAFRDEVAGFIRDNLPPEIRRAMTRAAHLERDHIVEWHKILHAHGWAVTNWPLAWGGTDWTPVQRYLFKEQLQGAPAPEPLTYNVNMIGPVLIAFGTEAQKQRFVPRIAALDDWWCQGFSEPGAGSDLASLKTNARRDGEHYVLNGQKTWTSQAQFADWMFLLARTDPNVRKQQGISMLLLDMKTPGITVRPIRSIDNAHYCNEVFFDDVRVPIENLVGTENRGWDCAKFLLGNERSGIARVGLSRGRLQRARHLAGLNLRRGKALIDDPAFLERLTIAEVELKALEITQLRVALGSGAAGGNRPDPASSILKLKGTQIQQAAMQLLLEAAGPDATRLDADDELAGVVPTYFFARTASIYGGSNEIQRNIIARAILEL